MSNEIAKSLVLLCSSNEDCGHNSSRKEIDEVNSMAFKADPWREVGRPLSHDPQIEDSFEKSVAEYGLHDREIGEPQRDEDHDVKVSDQKALRPGVCPAEKREICDYKETI